MSDDIITGKIPTKGQTCYLCKYVEKSEFLLSTLKIKLKINNRKKEYIFFLIAEEKDEKAVSVSNNSMLPFRPYSK